MRVASTWGRSGPFLTPIVPVAVAPSSAGNLPYQLVKANPAEGKGAMTGVTYIQRVALKGGVAPASECSPATKGKKEIVKYQADYIFYKAS